jgi:hypothetical protein
MIASNKRLYPERFSSSLGTATVPVALVGVPPASPPPIRQPPFGGSSYDAQFFGRRPKTASGTLALPGLNCIVLVYSKNQPPPPARGPTEPEKGACTLHKNTVNQVLMIKSSQRARQGKLRRQNLPARPFATGFRLPTGLSAIVPSPERRRQRRLVKASQG